MNAALKVNNNYKVLISDTLDVKNFPGLEEVWYLY